MNSKFFVGLLIATTCNAQSLQLRTNDVIAFLGGTDVVTAQDSGHLEAILSIHYRTLNLRFRNFGWEGDTVFAQPREFGFPPLTNLLQRAGVTLVFLQFGRSEALEEIVDPAQFRAALERFVARVRVVTPRICLVTPPPFERAEPPLPDMANRNQHLALLCEQVRHVARAQKLPITDLFKQVKRTPGRLTVNGLFISPRGYALLANAFMRELGHSQSESFDAQGRWLSSNREKLRQLVLEKDRLWFHYSRPQNWAFLGGDRVTQPSSHDHRNPKVRWFPAEMERYIPLIQKCEEQIDALALEIK